MTSDALAALESRLRLLEDERDIAQLIARYGPAVDSADADRAASLWAIDGTYDVEGWRMDGRNAVHAMVGSSAHRELVAAGCCHFLGPTVVTVTGDTAVALCESLVVLRSDNPLPDSTFRVWRATANHFELARVDGKWLITKRTSRLLDGDPAAHGLLKAGLSGDRRLDL